MEKKNTGLIVLIIILGLIILGLGGYIVYDKVLSKNNDNKENKQSIKLEEEKDYVYDATYTYDNKYTEFDRNSSDDGNKKEEITFYGIPFEYTSGMQYLSNLKVPYINIKSDDAASVNKKIETIYIDNAKLFDICAEESEKSGPGCTQVLTYRTYTYDKILSIVVISAAQSTSKWVPDYYTYNFDLETGKLLDFDTIVTKLGYDKNTVVANIKKAINEKQDSLYKEVLKDLSKACYGDNKNCYEVANNMLDESINNKSLNYFASADGKLNTLSVPYSDAVQNGEHAKYLITVEK